MTDFLLALHPDECDPRGDDLIDREVKWLERRSNQEVADTALTTWLDARQPNLEPSGEKE